MKPLTQKTFARPERGFALLITITLLAFLVLLLVSLATLTRVETQVAGNNQQVAQARQNALLALNIAVGQLQKYTGPDQRTTARADLQNTPGQTNAMWTGAYGSSVRADYADTPNTVSAQLLDSTKVNTYGSSARLLNWLVSGNEGTAFNPAWTTGDVGANGQIVNYPDPASTTAIPFKPAGLVTGLTPATQASSTSIKIANAAGDAKDARLLVGGNSVTSSLDASGKPIDYVVAPVVDINIPPSQVPGFGTTGSSVTVGRYAWWVGDEGVKARLNLPLAGIDTSLSTAEQLAQKQRAFSSASRTAIELMAKDTPGWTDPMPALNANRIDSLYDAGSTTRPVSSVVSSTQASMTSSNPSALATALKYRFHDVSTQSYSVLSDTYAGGLKKDLTRVLEATNTSPANATTLWNATSSTDTTFVPTWGHLRSFYNTFSTGGVITPQLPSSGNGTSGNIGISPVVTYAGLGFSYASAQEPAPNVAINLNIYPIVVLWNPYTSTMAGRDYEVGIGYLGDNGRMKLQVNMSTHPDPVLNPLWVTKEIRDLRYGGKVVASETGATDLPIEYFRFKIQCPALAAGESKIFTLGPGYEPNANQPYVAGTNILEPGLNHYRYATVSSTTIGANEADKQFQFSPGSSANIKANGHAEVSIYLGDGTPPPVTATGSWDPTQNRWFQAVQRIDFAGITPSYTVFSNGALLRPATVMDEPAFKLLVLNTFSAVGRSYVLNTKFGGSIPRYRWIAQANVRAPTMFRSRFDFSFVVPYYSKAGTDATLWPTWFLLNTSDTDHASSGLSLDYDIGTNTAPNKMIDATLFEVRDSSQPLQSIAQLQHANLSLAGSYPAYPIGNSIADFRLRNTAWIDQTTGPYNKSGSNNAAIKQPGYYDISWLLNRTLWDQYFFSTIPASGAVPSPLPNPRIVRTNQASDSTLRTDAIAPAANLMIAGGFNINSTSEQAWRAVIGGVNQLAYNPLTANSGSALGVALSRFRKPTAGTTSPTGVTQDRTYNGAESDYAYYRGDDFKSIWQGYRVLDSNQISQLARNIVAEIRIRGPFVSLNDFINRRLIDNSTLVDNVSVAPKPYAAKTNLTEEQKARFLATLKGTIQAAIDITPRSTATSYAINDGTDKSFWQVTRTVSDLPSGTVDTYSIASARGDINPPPLPSEPADADKTPQRNTSAFAPKFLTQADVLSNIGATLSARSDTFVIRTCGEAVNPTTQETTGRAWCEAVVQRLPDYVVSGSASGANAATDTPASLNDTNQKFGRQFKIVSFRWLTSNDI